MDKGGERQFTEEEIKMAVDLSSSQENTVLSHDERPSFTHQGDKN